MSLAPSADTSGEGTRTMSNERTVTLRVNGREERGSFPAHRTLLEALRQIGHMEVKCGLREGRLRRVRGPRRRDGGG